MTGDQEAKALSHDPAGNRRAAGITIHHSRFTIHDSLAMQSDVDIVRESRFRRVTSDLRPVTKTRR